MNRAHHPALVHHVALMSDAHQGYGMPIGGVVAAKGAVIPAAVGVDIGCGMIATETDIPAEAFAEMSFRRAFQEKLKERIPVGEGGGQMLRTSLALSAANGKPFEMVNIRVKREKPGLKRQHLTCVRAVTRYLVVVQGAEKLFTLYPVLDGLLTWNHSPEPFADASAP